MGDLISRSALIDSLYEHEFQIYCPLDDVSTVIDAEPAVDAVPRDEYDSLLKRIQHLLESNFIRSFDEVKPLTGTYNETSQKRTMCSRCDTGDGLKAITRSTTMTACMRTTIIIARSAKGWPMIAAGCLNIAPTAARKWTEATLE